MLQERSRFPADWGFGGVCVCVDSVRVEFCADVMQNDFRVGPLDDFSSRHVSH